MNDGPEWFAPKHYGYGSGFPISWQGWLVTLIFAGLIVGISVEFKDRPLVIFALTVPATAVLLVIAARTTRGGWRWRWGGDEE
jgi:hypothetical protein